MLLLSQIQKSQAFLWISLYLLMSKKIMKYETI